MAATPLVTLGRSLAGMWRALATAVGALARAVGRNAATARELDPEHRRDAAALTVLLLAVVAGLGLYLDAAGPVGRGLADVTRVLIGTAAYLLPVVLGAAAVHMLRQVPRPQSRGRAVVGGTALTLAVVGLLHLGAGSPATTADRAHSGGLLGAAVGVPLAHGLSAALAVPVLFVLGVFGVLVVTATPLSVLRGAAGSLLRRRSGSESDSSTATATCRRRARSRRRAARGRDAPRSRSARSRQPPTPRAHRVRPAGRVPA